jgi:hypothetical protein
MSGVSVEERRRSVAVMILPREMRERLVVVGLRRVGIVLFCCCRVSVQVVSLHREGNGVAMSWRVLRLK